VRTHGLTRTPEVALVVLSCYSCNTLSENSLVNSCTTEVALVVLSCYSCYNLSENSCVNSCIPEVVLVAPIVLLLLQSQ
jgi:hypothetical protein